MATLLTRESTELLGQGAILDTKEPKRINSRLKIYKHETIAKEGTLGW
jgi:hypothetical protein